MNGVMLRFKIRDDKAELMYFANLELNVSGERVVVNKDRDRFEVTFYISTSKLHLVNTILDMLKEGVVNLTLAQKIIDMLNMGERRVTVTYSMAPRSLTLDVALQ